MRRGGRRSRPASRRCRAWRAPAPPASASRRGRARRGVRSGKASWFLLHFRAVPVDRLQHRLLRRPAPRLSGRPRPSAACGEDRVAEQAGRQFVGRFFPTSRRCAVADAALHRRGVVASTAPSVTKAAVGDRSALTTARVRRSSAASMVSGLYGDHHVAAEDEIGGCGGDARAVDAHPGRRRARTGRRRRPSGRGPIMSSTGGAALHVGDGGAQGSRPAR